MGKRIGLLVSAVLAGAALATASGTPVSAADECLAKPKGPAPAGKHWYYRTNREIKRKCWFLADEGAKTVAVAPPKEKEEVAPAPADQGQKEQPSTADARAELVDEPRNEQPAAPAAQPRVETVQQAAPEVAVPESAPPESAPSEIATPREWTVASRWPDVSDAFSSVPATTGSTPARVPKTEYAAALVAAPIVPVDPSPVAAGNSANYGFVFAAAILAVAAGGAIVMFFASRRREWHHVSTHEGMPRRGWLRGRMAAAGSAGAARTPTQHELREEIEELLEVSRRARVT